MVKEEKTIPVSLRMTASKRKEMKKYALEHDMSLRELIEKAFEFYKKEKK